MIEYEPVIGLEVHAELQTNSKMFCSCAVVDNTRSEPNVAVCPVCAGMPGVLPVINQQAVEMAIKVGLALECTINPTSLFARKNYFYPDLPKGYQISQYEYPLASNGVLRIHTSEGDRTIRVLRAHLEEDTGKLTHVDNYSLVDLNRAGVPLLEIVSQPDMHSAEEARAYGMELRAILRALGVNSGDMEKGVIRFEANVSVRPRGTDILNTRVEIKNLNSFRAMERAIIYQIEQQTLKYERGEKIVQETLGWDESRGETYSQRSKEEAHDYRYFPEPDLPPLIVENAWVDQIRASLPELPKARLQRFIDQYQLTPYDAAILVQEASVADYFEAAVKAVDQQVTARVIALWITGELFSWMKQAAVEIEAIKVGPESLAALLQTTARGDINQNTAKNVLGKMLESGRSAGDIIKADGLMQISDNDAIVQLIDRVIEANPGEVANYLAGKETLANWFFGQVMRQAGGKANPQVVRAELERRLSALKTS
ncbi:MAG: Asp-tRNA(Asn)/Glu-tRNA(Gln) amidotransferase subunit GatB [Anaerolineae bacterium]|nr:Asp-tRNA(Asn)/Glu-tRNA(Gln) amidotransferase subunit GatB [Anaerolineae bacterium]